MARAVKVDQSKQDEQLDLKQFQLSSLLEITQAINQNFSAEQLYSIYKFVMRTQLKIRKMVLFVNDEGWTVPVSNGVGSDYNDLDVDKYLSQFSEITMIDESFPEILRPFETIVPMFHKDKPLAYTLIGDISIGQLELKADLIPFIQTLMNIIIVANENKKFGREQIKQQAMKIELALAAQMQTMLIPDDLPQDKDVEMYASYLPHQEIGGDYYDYIKLNEDEFLFCMADVSGKGIPAALLMSNFQANLSALAHIRHSLSQLVIELNLKVTESARGEKFITLFIAKYNRKTKTLKYVNAGHNPPMLLNQGKTILLEDGCTGLGMIDRLEEVKEGFIHIESDSVFLSYTDGVVETINQSGESYDMNRLINFFNQNAQSLDTKNFNEALLKDLENFKDKKRFADDVTLLVCKFK